MLFSIIVPIYNMEEHLSSCINSLLNQTHADLEIILVNDGSTDNSSYICNQYAMKDDRIQVVDKINGGLPSARNAGLEIAKGEYIGFLDSDDLLMKDTLNKIDKLSEIDADIIQYKTIRFENDYDIYNYSNNTQHESNYYIYDSCESLKSLYTDQEITFTVTNKFFKSKILSSIKFHDNARYFAEDVLFTVQAIINASTIIRVDFAGYFYRKTPNSMVTVGLNYNKFVSSMYSYNKCREYLRVKDEYLSLLADKHMCLSIINWRIRYQEIINRDRKKVNIELSKLIEQNIANFLRNPTISKKHKLLIMLSSVSLKFIDTYKVLSKNFKN